MLRPLALMGAALVTAACAGSAPGVLSTTRPLAAPFLGDRSTLYEGGGGDSAAGAAAGTTPAAVTASRAIGEAVHRARAPGASGALLVLRRGADTLAVEQVARVGSTMSASLALRSDVVVSYTLLEHADGTAERLEASFTPFGAAAPHERFWASFIGDSIVSRTAREGRPTIHGGGHLADDVVPYIEPSPALLEQIVRHARHSNAPFVHVPVLVLGDPTVVVMGVVVFQGADSAVVSVGEVDMRLAVDAEGRLLGGSIPDQGITIERVDLGPQMGVARRP